MKYSKYLDSSADLVLKEGIEHDLPFSLVVVPNGGNVQIQFMEPPQTWAVSTIPEWFTPTSAEYTLDEKTVYRIERGNTPPMRIIATGNALFSYHDNQIK